MITSTENRYVDPFYSESWGNFIQGFRKSLRPEGKQDLKWMKGVLEIEEEGFACKKQKTCLQGEKKARETALQTGRAADVGRAWRLS